MVRPRLQVIVGSTRQARKGPAVATWFVGVAETHGGFEVELVDLAEVNLPLLDEPNHPRLQTYLYDHTKAWSAIVERADAYVFVVPEYNHGMNAATKNALDYLHREWAWKGAGIVSYGGVAAGTRAAQQLKQVLVSLRMTPVFASVPIPFVAQWIDEAGRFQAGDEMVAGARALLDELGRVTEALAPLRTAG